MHEELKDSISLFSYYLLGTKEDTNKILKMRLKLRELVKTLPNKNLENTLEEHF